MRPCFFSIYLSVYLTICLSLSLSICYNPFRSLLPSSHPLPCLLFTLRPPIFSICYYSFWPLLFPHFLLLIHVFSPSFDTKPSLYPLLYFFSPLYLYSSLCAGSKLVESDGHSLHFLPFTSLIYSTVFNVSLLKL